MEVNVITDEKDLLEIEVSSLTIAEILRVYLNNNGAKLAAWRREHPTKNPIFHIEGENPKKILKKAISELEKDVDKAVDDFKKLK